MLELLLWLVKLPFVLLGFVLSVVFGTIGLVLSIVGAVFGGPFGGLWHLIAFGLALLLLVWLLTKLSHPQEPAYPQR